MNATTIFNGSGALCAIGYVNRSSCSNPVDILRAMYDNPSPNTELAFLSMIMPDKTVEISDDEARDYDIVVYNSCTEAYCQVDLTNGKSVFTIS
jgi:hypothetical protein